MIRRYAPLLAVLLLLAGCGLGGRGQWNPFGGASQRHVTLFVENGTMNDVRVRVVTTGERRELGMVGARSRQRYSIPWTSTATLRLQIEVLAGRTHTTQSVGVTPGDWLELVVRDPVQRSSFRR